MTKPIELLYISDDNVEDPAFMMAMEKLFDLANEMGRKGLKVGNLRLQKNSGPGMNLFVCDIKTRQSQTDTGSSQ